MLASCYNKANGTIRCDVMFHDDAATFSMRAILPRPGGLEHNTQLQYSQASPRNQMFMLSIVRGVWRGPDIVPNEYAACARP